MLTLEEFQRLNKRLKMALEKSFKVDIYDLSKQDVNILLTIKSLHKVNKNVSASDIARRHFITIPAVMHRLSILEKRKFIERENNLHDRRIRNIVITDEAEQFCRHVVDTRNNVLGEYLNYLGEDKVAMLQGLLEDSIAFFEVREC